MTVFVDIYTSRTCPVCKAMKHWERIIQYKYPEVVVRHIDVYNEKVDKFYRRNLVIDVRTARMDEKTKKSLLEMGMETLKGVPTIVIWSDKYPLYGKIIHVKYGGLGSRHSPLEQDEDWKRVMRIIDYLYRCENGFGDIHEVMMTEYEFDVGWS